MKKITLYFFLLFSVVSGSAQCIATSQYPTGDVISENEGAVQQISDCNYAGEYAVVTNLIIGNNYQFAATGGIGNYITVTTTSNVVIASGASPLIVNAISSTDVRVHFFTDASCGSEEECRETSVQCISPSCVPVPPPANDECSNAVTLAVDAVFCNGSNTNGTNVNATNSGLAAATCFDYGDNDVWYSFTVPANTGTVDISTDFTGGTLVDTEVAVYSGTCGALSEVSCDQDGGTTVLSNGFSWNSLLSNVSVNVGQTYYVRVSGYDEFNEGTFCLKISTNQTLSAQDFAEITFKAYPNPVKDRLHLSYSSEISSVSVYNMLGQEVLVKEINATNSELDFTDLTVGSYVVKVTINGMTKTLKVIKQ